MLRHRPTLGVILGCLALAGCTQADSTNEQTHVDVPCRETTPAAPTKLPRALRLPGDNDRWFGARELWTGLPTDYDAGRHKNGYVLKYPWVTVDNHRTTSKFGPPAVHAKRIDGPGHAVGDFGGYATTHHLDFWPSSIVFPSRGCWVVTGKLRTTVVRFILEV